MPLIAVPPHIRILTAMQAAIAGEDFMADAGTSSAVTVRQSRNRKPVRAERPAITLIFVGDSPTQGDTGHSMDEIQRRMIVDLQADAELDAEEAGTDPTGLLLLSRMLAVACRVLRIEGGPIAGNWCDWVEIDDLEPDERSTPDDGRLVRAVTVVYRTHARDENVLLALGANA